MSEFGFVRRAFADALRDDLLVLDPLVASDIRLSSAVEVHGWEGAKTRIPEVRRLMQVYGTEVRRSEDPDVWIKRFRSWVDHSGARRVVVPDVRFPNEATALTHLIRVERPGVGPVNAHVSDNLVDQLPVTVTIRNNGSLIDLQNVVREVFGTLLA